MRLEAMKDDKSYRDERKKKFLEEEIFKEDNKLCRSDLKVWTNHINYLFYIILIDWTI